MTVDGTTVLPAASSGAGRRGAVWLGLGPMLLLLTAWQLDRIYVWHGADPGYAVCADWATRLFLLSLLPGAFYAAVKWYAKSRIPLLLGPGFLLLILVLLLRTGFGDEEGTKPVCGVLLVAYLMGGMAVCFLPLSGAMADGFHWGALGKVVGRILIAPLYLVVPPVLLWQLVPPDVDAVSPRNIYAAAYAVPCDGGGVVTIRRCNAFSAEPDFSIRIPGRPDALRIEWPDDRTCLATTPDGGNWKAVRSGRSWRLRDEKTVETFLRDF